MNLFERFINDDTALVKASINAVKAFMIGLLFLTLCGFMFAPIKTFVNAQDFTGRPLTVVGLIDMINLAFNSWYVVLFIIPLSAIIYLFIRAYFIVETSKPRDVRTEDEEARWE